MNENLLKCCCFHSYVGMIPSPPARTNRYHPQAHNNNLAEMARLHRLGRAYSHEGVIESSLGGDIDIYYPDEDGKFTHM